MVANYNSVSIKIKRIAFDAVGFMRKRRGEISKEVSVCQIIIIIDDKKTLSLKSPGNSP